ncbi:TIGR04255 family protein [Acinetobacter baumannii]|uniref:TIGR04255 family protein n=1 Tax=Acinetobacter baumannii TaxID=470 RepID=UPI0026F86C1C|nr:TIGR04255 family protein [Acinetobacter baumannii]
MSSSPLIEVVFEVRFKPKNNFATELLIAINQLFGNHISIIHADGLQFPAEIKAQQPDIYYIPSYKINYPLFSLWVSDGSIVVMKNPLDAEYEGWDKFKSIPQQILYILKLKDKISDIHRFSLKYTNLIPTELALKDLNISLQIGNKDLDESAKLTLKTEVKEGNFISMTDISSHVVLENISDITGELRRISGTLFIIDVINNSGICNLENVDAEFIEGLEILHNKAKQIYATIYQK